MKITEIIKKIRIENNEVFITGDSNNVFPKSYREHKNSYCTNILQNEGLNALTLSLLKAYEEGNFQAGTANKYSRAIMRLMEMPEYAGFNWRNKDYQNDNDPIAKARESEDFNTLLLKAYNTPDAKERFIISMRYADEMTRYLFKKTTKCIIWTAHREKAKAFTFKGPAEQLISNYSFMRGAKIEIQ